MTPVFAVDASRAGRGPRGHLWWATALGLAYFAGSELGYVLSLGPSVGGTFWPPAGIALAFFLATAPRQWPWLLAGAASANILSDVLHGQTMPASLGFAVANLGEPILATVLLRRFLGTPVAFSRLSDVAALGLVVVFVSAPLAAAAGAGVAHWYTTNPPSFAAGWRTWWVGDAVGALVLTPFVLRIITDRRRLPTIAGRTYVEAAAFGVCIIAVTQIVFSVPPTSLAFPFLVFPVLMWGSVRLGVVAVGAALCLVVLLTAHDTASGLGPFAAEQLSLGDRLISLQIYVGIMALSFHGLAALWEERARTTAALRLAHSGLEARHHRIVEQSPLAIVCVQPDGTVRDANPAARQLRARPGPNAFRVLDDARVAPLITRAFAGEVVELPARELMVGAEGSGHVRRVRGFAYPVKDDKGGVAEVVLIEQDITDQVAARQQLVDANRMLREREEELSHALREMADAQAHREHLLAAERIARSDAERASSLKDEFLTTLSHELRTPLNGIVGWAHILRQSTEIPALVPAIDAIARNAQALATLIEDLLDMSRIMAGKVTLALDRVRIGDIVAAAASALQPVAREKGVTLVTDTGAVGDACLSADATRLRQVVTNLLDNGIKFTPAGGRVDLRVTADAHCAQIVVRDTGEGIHPDFLPAVFDRFRQADGSTTRRHGGLGLGLSIARQIVAMHNGSIQAQSDGPGLGAVFTVALPVAGTEVAAPASAGDDEWRAESLAGLRILVVDDNDDARELLRRLLTQAGCDVACSASAEDALWQLDASAFDLLLTDIGMPVADGFDLLRRVRAGAHGAMKVVAVTAFARPEDRDRVMAHGFDGHVPKPVNPTELLQLLERLAPTVPRGSGPDASSSAT